MTQPLDLLYLGTLPPHQGGSAIVMAQVLDALASRGHRIRAVGPITEEELGRGDVFAAQHPAIEVHRYLVPFLDTAPDIINADAYYEREGAQIAELLDTLIAETSPDIVISGRESFLGYVSALAERHGIPVVAFAQGSTTHAMVDGTYPPDQTATLIRQFQDAALVVSPARHMADSLRRLGVEGVQVVPNPVDLTRFRPAPRDAALAAELGLSDGAVVVAHLSNMIPVKRPLDIPAAAVRALADAPNLTFLVVGDGLLRGELEDACAAAGVTDRFRFTGWVDFADVPAYLSVVDIVVQPSSAEGQALVYLEAQATGLTVVASDIPSAREVIEDGETGLLYPAGDVGRFAQAIVRAAGDPELRRSVGARAMARARQHALPTIVAEHERLLGSVARSVGV